PDGVCWLQVRDAEVASQIVNFAGAYLDLKIPEGLALAAQVAYCWSHWPGSGRVLVVYDDVPEYKKVKGLLPPESGRFQVLMTTRKQRLARKVQSFQIEVLSEEDALELLRQIVGKERTDAEAETAKAICKWVGYLPLGVELLGCYLEENPEYTYQRLYQRLEETRVKTRALQAIYDGMTAERGVIDAFELSWERLSALGQKTAGWLSLFALAQIPWAVAASVVSEDRQEALAYARNELIARSLLQRPAPGMFQLHQLVREYFLIKLDQREDADELKKTYCQLMVSLAQQMLETPTRALLQRMTPLMPHIEAAAIRWPAWLSNINGELMWPFFAMASFYEEQGAYTQAECWYKKSIAITKSRCGESHPDVATSLNNLAGLYKIQGQYSDSETLYQDALALRRKLLGDEHPDIATSLNDLALLYTTQGRYDEAEPLHRNALSIRRKLLGQKHPEVATSLNNLGLLYYSQGRYTNAEPFYRDALKLRKKLFGKNHPNVANSLNNLAGLYESQGNYKKAEQLYRKALEMRRHLLGNKHPDVATSLNNLANLHSKQAQYSKAEPLYDEALTIRQDLFGEAHTDVANSLNDLAYLYSSQGRYTEAEPLFHKALALNRKLLGNHHPAVANNLNNLAYLYSSQNRYTEAEPLFHEALALYRKLFDNGHPDVAVSLNNLAGLYSSQGRYAEAEPLFQEALVLSRKLLGDDHLDMAKQLNNLAGFYFDQNRYADAEAMLLRAIAITINHLGEQHSKTQALIDSLLVCLAGALKAGKEGQLSNHPATQRYLAQLRLGLPVSK
ncbi:MAG: tetratricopeptide repeat protein, partial [Cyanobacteria bacterium J06626_6]